MHRTCDGQGLQHAAVAIPEHSVGARQSTRGERAERPGSAFSCCVRCPLAPSYLALSAWPSRTASTCESLLVLGESYQRSRNRFP